VEPVELGVQHRAHELRRPGAVAGEWLDAVAPALPVKSAGVDGATRLLGELWVAGRKAAAFAAGDVLVVVEAEGAGVADRAQFPAFVRAAHALTAIFENLEIVFAGYGHDRVHVTGRAPHMDGNDRLRVRPDGGANGPRRDRDALVDVDDHRNGSNRQNGGCRRHIGVGWNDDFVARTYAHRGQARRQRKGAAGGEREMTDAEIGGVALLEGRALTVFAVPKQFARPDDPGDRFDLLFADDIHGPSTPGAF